MYKGCENYHYCVSLHWAREGTRVQALSCGEEASAQQWDIFRLDDDDGDEIWIFIRIDWNYVDNN